ISKTSSAISSRRRWSKPTTTSPKPPNCWASPSARFSTAWKSLASRSLTATTTKAKNNSRAFLCLFVHRATGSHASVRDFKRSNAVITILAWRPIMKSSVILLTLLLVFSISCSQQARFTTQNAPASGTAQAPASEANKVDARATPAHFYDDTTQKVSLNDATKAELTTEAADRRIIRNADITMEVESTTDAQQRVAS